MGKVEDLLELGRKKGFLDKKQYGLLNELLKNIKNRNFEVSIRILYSTGAKNIFEKDEKILETVRNIVMELEQKHPLFVFFTPTNSTPNTPINIHSAMPPGYTYSIGQGPKNIIQLVDAVDVDETDAEFVIGRDRFGLRFISDKSKIEFTDDKGIKYKSRVGSTEEELKEIKKLGGGVIFRGDIMNLSNLGILKFKINGYEFDVETTGKPKEVHETKFPVVLRLETQDTRIFFTTLFTVIGMENYGAIDERLDFGMKNGFLNERQFNFFNRLISIIKNYQFGKAMQMLYSEYYTNLFKQFEPDVNVTQRLMIVVEELEQKHQYILTLTPEKNITGYKSIAIDREGNPTGSIIIIGSHHTGKGDELLIGIDAQDCDIVLDKTAVQEKYHSAIRFDELNKRFAIRRYASSVLKINNYSTDGDYIQDGVKLQINEYVFEVKISSGSGISPSIYPVHLTFEGNEGDDKNKQSSNTRETNLKEDIPGRLAHEVGQITGELEKHDISEEERERQRRLRRRVK